MCRSNPLPSTLPSSPFCSILNTSYITASDMCEVCTEAVHSTSNTSYITGFAVCSYLTHLWCSYLSPKTGISVFLFDAFVVFLFEPGPILGTQTIVKVWVDLAPGARVRPSTNHWVSYQPTIGFSRRSRFTHHE